MPFTLAHPVAVLPLARCKYLHFPALVLGSLAPDFVYFLGGRAAFGIGHTFLGFWVVNLPLCFVFYGIYVYLWRDVLRDYLPQIINFQTPKRAFRQPVNWFFVFTVSAMIGMASHVFLDDFTHESGYFVVNLPILREVLWHLPLFKWLQYGGGVLGLLACAWFVYANAKIAPQHSPKSAKQKWIFWAICFVIMLILLIIWQIVSPISLSQIATWVIRMVDCGVLALSILALQKKLKKNLII